MRVRVLVPLVLFACGLAVVPADAQTVNAPPGLSGVDEYLETVPGATGPERPKRESLDDPKVAAEAREVIAPKTLRALRRAGKDGRRAAELAAAGAPTKKAARKPVFRLGDPPSSGAADGVADVLGGGAGAGWIFPAGLVAITVLLAIVGLRRRHAA
jgi:hypothetical protein